MSYLFVSLSSLPKISTSPPNLPPASVCSLAFLTVDLWAYWEGRRRRPEETCPAPCLAWPVSLLPGPTGPECEGPLTVSPQASPHQAPHCCTPGGHTAVTVTVMVCTGYL